MTILDETYTLAGGVEIKDYDEAVASIDESLKKLGLEYIDLMLIHSPQPWDDFRGGEYAEGNRAAWRALEEAHQAGRIRSIGVSNFQQQDLENILQGANVVPHVNQLLVHAGNTPSELLDHCEDKEILAAVHPLHPAAGHGVAAQDGEPRPHALQRRGRLRDLRRRHGRPARPAARGLRGAQRVPRLQREVTPGPQRLRPAQPATSTS